VDPRERCEIYNGAGDAWSRAVELTATPLIFGFLGYRLDLWIGTLPVFTVVFSAFCLGYSVWKVWAGYEAAMQVHEAQLLAGRRRGITPTGDVGPAGVEPADARPTGGAPAGAGPAGGGPAHVGPVDATSAHQATGALVPRQVLPR
jgi:F0F1-type ATP synthase assembly protein I